MSYFKITSNVNFEELKLTGTKIHLHTFEAKILPDRNFVSDLIINEANLWKEIDEQEYMDVYAQFLAQQ